MNATPRQGQVPGPAAAVRRLVDPAEAINAARTHWDRDSAAYLAEHGAALGVSRLLWCPEGVDEAEARLLGEVRGLRVLELGCGAAQGARWLRSEGARVVGLDVSRGMLNQSARLDDEAGVATPVLQGSAERLPFADGSFDVVVSAFGALPFVADAAAALTEVRRVLVPHGRCVASVMHPLRWVFPDSPDPATLTVATSYFDRTPYVEEDRSGRAVYTEHHRTVGDWIRAVRQAGMVLEDLVEPEWSPERGSRWGAWSPERGALIPGTAILVLHRD